MTVMMRLYSPSMSFSVLLFLNFVKRAETCHTFVDAVIVSVRSILYKFLPYPFKTDIDDCASHPCKNNGTCTDQVNGFNCSCAPGFNGTQCETGI